jgi:hypothetical protein
MLVPAARLICATTLSKLAPMIITHAKNGKGQIRLYIGGKSSVECWIEPQVGTTAWSFHMEEAFCGNRLSDADKKIWAQHMLLQLADALNVAPADLADVPFETITALHDADPFVGKRMAAPRRQKSEFSYMTTPPNVTRPSADYGSHEHAHTRRAR